MFFIRKKRIIYATLVLILVFVVSSFILVFSIVSAKEKIKIKIPKTLSKEISEKYTVFGNTFVRKVKDDPKNKIEVEVGNINDPESFSPKVKIKRWDDEVNFSVELIDNEADDPVVTTDQDKIKWTKNKREAKFYELPVSADLPEGGYEFEITLKEKPLTNKTEFNIETAGLDFFYQPELTQEEKDQDVSRSDNVVGSYAVYTSENKINNVGGKEYKSGKVGHIYRPKINDSAGNWTWGNLTVDKNAGKLTVEIPQEFLDNAVYPVTHAAGLTFGYTTQGSSQTSGHDQFFANLATGVAGTITSISAYGSTWNSPFTGAALYLHSNLSLITSMFSGPAVDTPAWTTMNVGSSSISAVDYLIAVANINGGWKMNFDTGGSTDQGHFKSTLGGSEWPNPINSLLHDDLKYSIYATYTVGGGNSTPTTPTLSLPTNSDTNQSTTPIFKTVTTDTDSDSLQYELKICTDSNMTTACNTFAQNVSNIGWSGQNIGTSAFSTGTTATYTLQVGNSLAESTIYYWKTRAIDPAGSNNWSGTQTTAYSFTTSGVANSAPANISLGFSNPQTSNFAIANNSTEWSFQAVVTDADGYANLNTVKLKLADDTDNSAPFDDLEFSWTQSSNSFSETGTDSLTAATLSNPTSSCSGNSCTLNFKIKFLDTFTTKKTNYSAQLITADDSAASDTDTYSNIYQVYPDNIASSTSATSTANSFQRKTWFDGARYWSALNANSQIEFWYSTDQKIWTENTSARIAVDTADFSIEADSTNAFITYTNTYSVLSRQGTSYPAVNFAWGNATIVYTGTGESDKYNFPSITRDSSANVWISATQKSGSGGGGSWDITAAWNTGDINSRVTNASAVIDKAHNGTPYIISPVQHGVKCFNQDGVLQWTYTGITNGYDVRAIATGDLNSTGYNDVTVVGSGYYNTATDGKIAILDKDGNTLQLIKTSDFGGTAPTQTRGIALDGTDIYATTDKGVTKFVKSGSTWSEDKTGWAKMIGGSYQITVADMGNGKRVYVAQADIAGMAVYAYQTNGTEDWHYHTNNQYQKIFAIGKSDNTKTGKQMAIPYQSGFAIIDKDGALSQNWTTAGNNVRVSATFYDADGDGEDEIYFSDMGDDVFAIERTGSNTYSEKYHKVDLFNVGKYGGLTHYDINADGSDEIIATSTDGHVYVYDKTLTTLLKDLTIAHGTAGGYWTAYQMEMKGVQFADTSGDGHADLIVSGTTGYADVYETSGFDAPLSYTQKIVKSASPNSISAWGTPTTLNTSTNSNQYGLAVPRSSGSVYGVWMDGTDIEGKNFNGSSWDTNPTAIAVGITGITNDFSALSDSSGNVHLAYIDSANKINYKQYTSSWQDAVVLDDIAGSSEVTISIDTTGSNGLYAFWIRNNDIYYRRACSPYTSWDNAVSLETTNTNTSLTSSLSDFSSGRIFVQYTQGSVSPYVIKSTFVTSTTCSSNTPPSAPQTSYVNNNNAQSGQSTPVAGLTDHSPAFSAIFDDPNTSNTSSSYQIQVGNDSDWSDAAELWDSGKSFQSACNENSRCSDITYTGSTLSDGSTYYWRIKFWDNLDSEGSWSTTQQFSMNSLPTVSSVVINGGNNINLNENSSIGVSWTSTITDTDGYANISLATGKIYRSGLGSTCTLDNNNCYSDAVCDLSSCSSNSCTALCSADLYFFTQATDVGSTYASQYYQAWVQATDIKSEIGSTISSSTTFDVNTMSGFSIASSLVYGEVFAGSDTGSSNTITTVTNTGNSLINLEITGDYMCTDYPSCGGGTIDPVNQQYKLSSFTYGSGTTLSTSPQVVNIGISEPTQSPSNSFKNLYWGIGIPESIGSGSYQGATTILVY